MFAGFQVLQSCSISMFQVVSWGNLGFNLGPARSGGCMLEIKRKVLHADRSFVEDLGFQGPHESTTSAHQFATMK